MKLNYRLIQFLVLILFPFQLAFSNLDSLKHQFSFEKGVNQISTGLIICDSLVEEPEQQIEFATTLISLAKKETLNSILLAKIHMALSNAYVSLDSLEKSIEQLQLALVIAENQQNFDTVLIAKACNDLGLNYIELGDFNTAKKFVYRAIELYEKARMTDDVANVKSDLAIVFHSQGKYPEAISLFNEVYEMDLKAGDKRNQSSSLNNIGRMYVDWKKYDTGLDFYFRSIQLLDTIADQEVLGIRYNNIGMVYQLMGKHREAISWFEKARKIEEQENSLIKLGIRYHNLGNSYLALNDYSNARKNLEKSLAIFINSNMFSRISKVYGSLGSLYLEERNFTKAEEYLILSQNMAEKGENIPEISISYSKLYQLYKQTGNFKKALDFYEKHTVAKDSIYNLQASKQIEELEAQYQNDKKEAEITRLEKENELKIKELAFKNRQRNWAISGLTILMLVSIIMYFLFSTVKRQKAELSKQNNELDRLNQTLNRLFAIISHDLRNATAAYQSSAKIIDYHLSKGQPEKLLPLSGEISNNARNLSAMLENLLQWSVTQIQGIEPRKQVLIVKEELVKVVDLLKSEAEKKFNEIRIATGNDDKVWCDPESFNMIVRNLLGNALKFTSNGVIQIESVVNDGFVILKITDTGCGIPHSMLDGIFKIENEKIRQGTSGEKGTGLGLLMVAEHVAKNGGTIGVESEEGKGTTFIVTLPSKNN